MRIVKEIEVNQTFRVAQISSLFDVPITEKVKQEWEVDLPFSSFDWQVGLIVGPSGSGKSTIARELWPNEFITGYDWNNQSILDNFPQELSSKEVINALTSVGFSSPPDWVKPYSVLSTGQKMRADLARALATDKLVVFDEFTSVVDRTVAQVGSAALAKAIRKKPGRQFVAVTCHADVLEWLCPDWIYEPHTNQFARGYLQRPKIELKIYRTSTKAWELFKQYHYLSSSLHIAAQCYIAEWNNEPVGFVAVLPVIGFTNSRRESRIVVRPDYQGIGIGAALSSAVAEIYLAKGMRYRSTTSHPGFIAHRNNSKAWVLCEVKKTGSSIHGSAKKAAKTSTGRGVATFEYVGNNK